MNSERQDNVSVAKFDQFLRTLVDNQIEFVVIGGLAASTQGSAQITYDIDICYGRDDANLKKLAETLQPFHPTLRGAPSDLPFKVDAETLKAGLNFTFSTDLGDIDLLGEVAGIGMYKQVEEHSQKVTAFGVRCRALTLEGLIKAKRASGRPKDLRILPELEALLELRRSQNKK
jgi:predicted nucleotidyltransferase